MRAWRPWQTPSPTWEATLRYQFPFMERGSKRVDAPPVAQAAVAEARRRMPGLPLFD